MSTSSLRRLAALAALALTLGLFVVGGRPEAGRVFAGNAHWIAHFVSYALIAVAYRLALPGFPTLGVAAIVAGIGTVHEVYEIEAHSHPFEPADALVNAVGAVAGAWLARRYGNRASVRGKIG